MNNDELVHDMYSRLNLIINELHSIGLTKLDDADIVRKIISVLPHGDMGTFCKGKISYYVVSFSLTSSTF